MKKNITRILLAFALIFTLGSCEKWIDPEINIDPDQPVTVDMQYMLISAQTEMAYVLGGADVSGITSMWMQYVKGEDRQFKAIYTTYNIQGNGLNNCWENIYAGFMNDLNNIMIKASDTKAVSPHYSGVAKVMMAQVLGTTTSLWGDIPYSDAFGKGDNLKAAFDSQQEIYSTINRLLTEAINDLSGTSVIALSGDLIYNNDITIWKKLAYTLRARYSMHLTKKGSVNYTNVLSDLSNGIGTGEDFKLAFGTTEVNANPLYQFRDQRDGYAAVNDGFKTIVGTDPRGAVMNDVVFGSVYSSIDSDVAFMTYAEALYIKAEAMKRNGDTDANVKAAIEAADAASFDFYGVSGAAPVVSATPTIEDIIKAKYIHMFMNTEAFVDYRRTGYPTLTPTSGNLLPSRFPYASDEAQYNSNTPSIASIFVKLWAFE